MLGTTARRQMVADLDALMSDLPQGRKLPADHVAKLVRHRASIDIVTGVAGFTPGSGGVALAGDTWRGSATQVYESRLFRLTEIAPMEWLTAPVPAGHSGVVAFVFSMALGNGAAYPQPTATFVVEADGHRLAEFCVARSARLWGGERGLFEFWPLRVDATAFGYSFDVDDTITRESLFADGYGVLAIPGERLRSGQPARIRVHGAPGHEPTRHWCRVSTAQPALYADTHMGAPCGTPSRPARGSSSVAGRCCSAICIRTPGKARCSRISRTARVPSNPAGGRANGTVQVRTRRRRPRLLLPVRARLADGRPRLEGPAGAQRHIPRRRFPHHPRLRVDVGGRTECQLTWRDTTAVRSRTSYFVKVVRHDHEIAWTSPTWLTER